MIRDTYVDSAGAPVDHVEKDRKWLKRNLIIIGVIVGIVLIFFITRNIIRANYCKGIIKKVADASKAYAEEMKTLPTSEGAYTNLDIETLLENKKIKQEDVTVNKKVATGKIKITKYKKEYIVMVDLAGCDYCDTSTKSWSKESTKKPNKAVVDVTAYYNYQTISDSYTNWTSYYLEDALQKEIDKQYKIRLPLDNNKLPKIPDDAKIKTIEQESKEYYRYRDKRWLYYKDRGGIYTDYFSSEQPAGFEKSDSHTMKYTEWSDYSTNYPEKKSYRMIEQASGYKWFYKKNGKTIYYKNGEYVVQPVGSENYQKDSKAGYATMYRYRDKQWRWYNGTSRVYSSYASTVPKGYQYRDADLMSYSGWSGYKETSSLTAANAEYREEEIQTRYRYRIHYQLISLPVLEKEIPKDKLETQLQLSLEEILKKEDLKVQITYKFKYKK